MAMFLKDALEQTFTGWRDDVNPAWRDVVDGVELGFDSVDETLTLEPWEPIFPARKGRAFPGLRPVPTSFGRSTRRSTGRTKKATVVDQPPIGWKGGQTLAFAMRGSAE